MDSIDSKLDLFQSLKDEDLSEGYHKSEQGEDSKFLSGDDDDAQGSTTSEKVEKKKIEKQNRKEVDEEEREKML